MKIYTVTTYEQAKDGEPLITIYKRIFINKEMAIKFAKEQEKEWFVTEYTQTDILSRADYERT